MKHAGESPVTYPPHRMASVLDGLADLSDR